MTKNKEKLLDIGSLKKLLQKNVDALHSKAEFLLQIKNISHSGHLVEEHVKAHFSEILKGKFRVTSGYIISAPDMQNINISPHVDLIVLDTLVPNTFFPQNEFSGQTEIVPKEAVVGVFEIKKTLTKKTIKQALDHLSKIRNQVGLSKTNPRQYMLGGDESYEVLKGVSHDERRRNSIEGYHSPLETGIYSNPILGVIGLEQKGKDEALDFDENNFADVIFSFDGFISVISSYHPTINNLGPIRSSNTSKYRHEKKSPINLNFAFGYITSYLYRTTGTRFDVYNYYLNEQFKDIFSTPQQGASKKK